MESTPATQDAFDEAQQEQQLREKIGNAGANAVNYGNLDRDWVNNWLTRLGANPVTGEAEYRINQPITGLFGRTIKATSRTEALAKFNAEVAVVTRAGKIVHHQSYNNVYRVTFADTAPTFHSGPEDVAPAADVITGLDNLKAAIRTMLREAVTEQGWSYRGAQQILDAMGLEKLPERVVRNVQVPVSGMATLAVTLFEEDGVEGLRRSTAAAVRRQGELVTVKAEEIGEANLVAQGADEESEEVPY
jgi:hypothetical protein